jgi:hypothetical protein
MHAQSMHVFYTSKQTKLAIDLLSEFNPIAEIRANHTKSGYITFKEKAKLPTKLNDQLIYPVHKNKNIRLRGGFY